MRGAPALALVVLIVLGACGDSSSSSSSDDGHDHDHAETAARFTEEEADSRAEVTLKDFEFAGLPPTLKGPKVYLNLVNVGAVQHELLVLAADGKEAAVAPPFPGGNNKSLAAEIPPGTYTVECRVKEGDRTHADLGMKATLVVS